MDASPMETLKTCNGLIILYALSFSLFFFHATKMSKASKALFGREGFYYVDLWNYWTRLCL